MVWLATCLWFSKTSVPPAAPVGITLTHRNTVPWLSCPYLCNNAILCFSQSKMLIKALSSVTCVCHIAMGNAEDFKAPLTRCIQKGLLKCFCALRDTGSNCLLTVIMLLYKSLVLPGLSCLSSRLKAMRRQGRNWDRGGEVTWMSERLNVFACFPPSSTLTS